MDLEDLTLDLSWDPIEQLKKQFFEETGKVCTKFDVIVAKVWQCRTRAINLETDSNIHLEIPMNARHLHRHVLPEEGGFYGNCIYPAVITATSGTIRDASFCEVVSLVREAKERLQTSLSKWMEGDETGNPFNLHREYNTLGASDLSRVGLNEVDYGWGKPVRFRLARNVKPLIPLCLLVKPPEPKQGVRLTLRCVVKEHLEAFRDQMMTWAQ